MTEETKKAPVMRFQGFSDDWEQRKFSNVVNRVSQQSNDSNLPKVEFEDIVSGEGRLNKDISHKFDSRKGTVFEPEFILYGKLRPYLKNWLFPNFKGIALGDFWVFEPNNSSSIFDYYLIQSDKYQTVANLSSGTKMPRSDWKTVSETVFSIPDSINEQEKIGKFFNQLDNTIALHQRKLEKTKALKSAYLSELFPVEGERKPKRRFAGFIDDWKQGTVGEYGYFYYGKSAPKWSVTKDAIIPCVRYGELYTKFGAKIDKVYSYTNISKENLKFSTGNEVLVPRVGEDPLDFANCSWLSIPNVAIGEMISVYNTEENPLFISYYFNSQLRHAFAKRVEGGNVSNLYFTYLENITISIPNKEEQDTIANFLESLDSVVEHHQHKLEKLKNIKQAYLNELFV